MLYARRLLIKTLAPKTEIQHATTSFLAGLCVGTVSTVFTHPFDLARSKMIYDLNNRFKDST